MTLAESLGMTTTAEGVETEVELEMVRQLGCKKVQGYYFGRPMPEEMVRDLLDRQYGLLEVARKA